MEPYWDVAWPDGHVNEWKSATGGEICKGRGRGHLEAVPKTWDRGGSQESMGLTLARHQWGYET